MKLPSGFWVRAAPRSCFAFGAHSILHSLTDIGVFSQLRCHGLHFQTSVFAVFSACDLMATPPIDISQVVQIAAQAAQAAAQAATALQRFTDRRDSNGKFSEAGKVVRQADPYGTDDIEQDIAKWTEFYDNFRAWLFLCRQGV